ncbi:MAG TPA: 2-dehydro-3-deoxygalactonokinase [Aestuariivirgaceae bacterium]|nr:2-dehydro-3-deoxygalactonokinase [Aestuariivirgaceae bacterium]
MMREANEKKGQPQVIAVDWGTTRFRAYLVGIDGSLLATVSSDEGISSAGASDFSKILAARCGEWLEAFPRVPVLMGGMIGSRNGWKEVPYVACPASMAEIKAGIQQVSISPARAAGIVPGLIWHAEGVADVIRGEETKIVGTGLVSGVAVLPGTHCKWARIAKGQVTEFRTYMTGEFYGLLRDNSVLRLLGKEPEESSGFSRGLAATARAGGLLHQAFEARTSVLDAKMEGGEVGPFLSGLLIGHEVRSALGPAGRPQRVTLVADTVLAQNYAEALKREDVEAVIVSPQVCFTAGMLRLVPEWL